MYEAYKQKITAFYERQRRMPGYEEIMALTGFRSKNSVYKLINKLVEDTIVVKDSKGRLSPGKALRGVLRRSRMPEDEVLARVVRRARELSSFVRIDMEESWRVDATLRIYRRLRAEGLDNVGVVLQSYLYRSPADLEDLLPLRPNLRLVKGAYLEPADVAQPRKAHVDAAYVRLAERALLEAGFTAVATHDERIIDHVKAFAARHRATSACAGFASAAATGVGGRGCLDRRGKARAARETDRACSPRMPGAHRRVPRFGHTPALVTRRADACWIALSSCGSARLGLVPARRRRASPNSGPADLARGRASPRQGPVDGARGRRQPRRRRTSHYRRTSDHPPAAERGALRPGGSVQPVRSAQARASVSVSRTKSVFPSL
jgi:hypothetical protein